MFFCYLWNRNETGKAWMAAFADIIFDLTECDDSWGETQAELKTHQCMGIPTENRYAIQCIHWFAKRIQAVMHGKGTAISGLFSQLLNLAVIRTAWIGNEGYRLFQMPFKCLACIL